MDPKRCFSVFWKIITYEDFKILNKLPLWNVFTINIWYLSLINVNYLFMVVFFDFGAKKMFYKVLKKMKIWKFQYLKKFPLNNNLPPIFYIYHLPMYITCLWWYYLIFGPKKCFSMFWKIITSVDFKILNKLPLWNIFTINIWYLSLINVNNLFMVIFFYLGQKKWFFKVLKNCEKPKHFKI